MGPRGNIVVTKRHQEEELFSVEPTEEILYQVFEDIFVKYYDQVTFGPMIDGATWEIRAPNAPERYSLKNGYLTVDFGSWHFHLCIGLPAEGSQAAVPEALQQHRRTTRAEFYRRLNADGHPASWGFRTFNGGGEQQITVIMPSPFYQLIPFMRYASPDWSKLAMWDALRKKYLGISGDSLDRQGKSMA